MRRAAEAVLAACAALVAMAGLGLIFYIADKKFGLKSPWVTAAAAVIGAGFILLIVAITARLGGLLYPSMGLPHSFLASRRSNPARLRRAVEKLASDPRWPHFAPLIRRWNIFNAHHVEQWDRRYRELLADPRRRHRAADILEGRFPSNDQIDYDDDETMLVTCEHLQPVERALKSSSISCVPVRDKKNLAAFVDLDARLLIARYRLPDCVVRYEEEVDPRGPTVDALCCTLCNSRILGSYGPRFPAA
ncbi:hypothetical protein [Terrarubrum flagellatum]|uniref:hypothetical protein n=1 Tax=Terrirubrum flagellatum TaxID=2895980 RepID=UPI00314523D9